MATEQLGNEIMKAVGNRTNGGVREVHKDIEQALGIVPGFFKMQPAEVVEHEWKVMRDFQLSDQTALDPKVKELIGLGVAAAMHCRYCSSFHSEAAMMNGATPEEVNEALMMAKHTAGWSTYLNGVRYDESQFDRELKQIGQHIQRQRAQ